MWGSDTRYLMCDVCGHRLHRVKDIFGNWDGESYYCSHCGGMDDDYDEDSGECLSAYDAALIWVSNGKDEDYMFGYTEEELEDALR